MNEAQQIKDGVEILIGKRPPKTKHDFECLELVAKRYISSPEQALGFALLLSSIMNNDADADADADD